jgi:integrase
MNNQICSYIFLRNNVYYFSRRVPLDMGSYYGSKRIVKSLKTRSKRIALRGSNQISFQLETYWSSIRVEQITKGLVSAPVAKVTQDGCGYDLFDARDNYLKLKGEGKDHVFERTVDRNVNYFIESVGNRDLSEYTSTDGAKFRDFLLAKGLAVSSIKRIFSSLGPIIKLMIQEHGLKASSPLAGTYMPSGGKKDKRQPIPLPTIRHLQSLCVDMDDDLRRIIALVSDTGMRLGEACGLERSDIVLDGPEPHVIIQPNSSRRLKTESSERKVPLVGSSLWAATQAMQNIKVPYRRENEFLFPRYTKGGKCNSNSASAALNKWMKQYVDDGCVIHSFRHSMRDRLRAVECPSTIVDQIGGWSRSSVGENYGAGYPLDVLHKWLKLIE